jgi:hypothetical protein
MPVDLFHRASCNCRTCGGLSGTVRPLLTRRRIILLENLLDDQIDIQRAASVTQEKRLLTVADENETVMGNDVRPGRGSMEFSFRNDHLPVLQMRMVRYAIRRRSSETTQRSHDSENVTRDPPRTRPAKLPDLRRSALSPVDSSWLTQFLVDNVPNQRSFDCAVLHSKHHTNQNHWNQNCWNQNCGNRECSTLLSRREAGR